MLRGRSKKYSENWISMFENPALIWRGADRKFSRQITKCNFRFNVFYKFLGDERLDILSLIHNS